MVEFDEALERLRQRIPASIGAPDLDRIRAVATLMGDPQEAYPAIHVTGTNGKTSVTRMVSALLGALGLSAGTYTSPHLQSVRERMSVGGFPISEIEFADVFAGLEPLLEMVEQERDDRVTYFEAVTAMAFWWFADKPVDVAVVEVGMGGRWDATNLVRGEVAVLSAIDVDHSELGDTPAEVAGEKSGIIKPGAIVISAQQAPDVLDVIQRQVEEVGATLQVAGRDFHVRDRRTGVGGQGVTFAVAGRTIDVFLPVFGAHQADNAALALAAVAAFLGEGWDRIDDDLIRQGFGAVQTPGRLEIVSRDPTVILDGAHNPHGARTAAAAVAEAFTFRNLVLVLAVLGDKDVRGVIEAYRDLANHVVVTRAPSPRSATVDRMVALAEDVWEGTGVIVEDAEDIDEALEKAVGVAGEGDGVLVTGSLYTVGAAREHYRPVRDGEPQHSDWEPRDQPDDPFDLLGDVIELDADAEE